MKVAIFGGYGRVGSVVTHKCAEDKFFKEIIVAGRNPDRAKAQIDNLNKRFDRNIKLAKVDGDDKEDVKAFLNKENPDLLLHVAEPFQNLTLMNACLESNTPIYLDTANHEAKDDVKFTSVPQWALHKSFEKANKLAILACGFDPGATNAMVAYAKKHFFDKISYIDIVDCNDGSHGKKFATNFNTALNLREVTQPLRYLQNNEFVEGTTIMDDNPMRMMIDYPGIGPKMSYVIYHEELESFRQNYPELKRARFWMTFGDAYRNYSRLLRDINFLDVTPLSVGKEISPLDYLKKACPNYESKLDKERLQLLTDLGLLRTDKIKLDKDLYPLEFLGLLLPKTDDLNSKYTGKTCIGVIVTGEKAGKEHTIFIYNICDHEESIKETGGNAIAFTTAIPAVTGAKMVLSKIWSGKGVYNVEELDPDQFMIQMSEYGLPWEIKTGYQRLPDKI